MKERTYICCDLKSFYASVECIERGLNPLDTNLVVADLSRTEKTICLAVTPSLKSYGISGRARLFEVIQRVKEVNAQRQRNTPGRQFTSASSHDPEVRRNPSLALDYIVAPPRMAHYIDWSTRVYSVYLKHVAPEDIYPYDIENLKGTVYTGEVTTDRYGRKIPKHAHGTVNLDGYTSSGEELLKAATSLYDRIVDKTLLARRLTLCANHLLDESSVPEDLPEQIDLFTDYSAKEKQKKEADTAHARERKLQETMLDIKKRFGKNAILKGLNLEDGATARERNNQIGGHKA